MSHPTYASACSLANFAFFYGCTETLLKQVEAVTRSQEFVQGEQILSCGQEGDGRIFFVESGKVSILGSPPERRSSVLYFFHLGPGTSFGEMVLLG